MIRNGHSSTSLMPSYYRQCPLWQCHRYLLGRDSLFLNSISLPTFYDRSFRCLRSPYILPSFVRLLYNRQLTLLPLARLQRIASRPFDSRSRRWRHPSIRASNPDRYRTTPSEAYILGCQSNFVGSRLNLWTVDRRVTRSTYDIAMDILPQLSFLRNWLSNCAFGDETTGQASFAEGATLIRRLGRRIPIHFEYL